MATTVKTGWLKDKNGDKFAPKTLTSQVQTADGVLLEDKIAEEINAAKEYTDTKTENLASTASVDTKISEHNTSPNAHEDIRERIDNLQTAVDAKVPTSRTINGKALTDNISITASDVGAYSKTEIDSLELITTADIDTICGTTIQEIDDSEVTF